MVAAAAAADGNDGNDDDLTFQNAASQHMFRLLFVSSPLDEKTNSENRRFPLVKGYVQPLHENTITSEGKTMACRTPRYTSTHLPQGKQKIRCRLFSCLHPRHHNAAGSQCAFCLDCGRAVGVERKHQIRVFFYTGYNFKRMRNRHTETSLHSPAKSALGDNNLKPYILFR